MGFSATSTRFVRSHCAGSAPPLRFLQIYIAFPFAQSTLLPGSKAFLGNRREATSQNLHRFGFEVRLGFPQKGSSMRASSRSRRPSAYGLPTESAPMRKLIRCISTQAFLTKECTWTKHIHKACHYPDFSAQAARTQFPEQDLQVYYSFDPNNESKWDFSLAFSYSHAALQPAQPALRDRSQPRRSQVTQRKGL